MSYSPQHGHALRALLHREELARRRHGRRLERAGWVRYPLGPDVNGGFREDMNLIRALVGSDCYEWQHAAGRFWIRRVG